ncbi:MAG TPA: hypothetical protein VF407_02395 [Polyangiaceae bacterium]
MAAKRPTTQPSALPYDVAALVLVAFACVAFVIGGTSMAKGDDLVAMYWLVVGGTTMLGGTRLAKTGGGRA